MIENDVSRCLRAGARGAEADGIVRVGPLMGLPGLVQALGYDPGPIFAGTGFEPGQFTDPDTEISFVGASKLLAHCAEATGCEHLGLLLGERMKPSLLGITGFMLQSAPDVGTALRDLVHNLDLQDRGALATLTIQGRMTYLGYAIHLSGVEATYQIYDLTMTVVCQVMRSLCGPAWNPQQVLLSHRQPQDLEPYRQFFRAPLLFDADRSAVAFQTQWLDHRITGADPLLHRHFEQEANRRHIDHHQGLVYQLRKELRRSLAVDRGDASVIARQLGMHVRTLNRRLREEGTSFRRELEEIRYEVARQLLSDTRLPLSKISKALGYADSTAFIRAFKRWSGTPPAQWREVHRRPDC